MDTIVHTIQDVLSLYTTFIGSVAERSKALVLGTSLFGGVGSNPTAANQFFYTFPYLIFFLQIYIVRRHVNTRGISSNGRALA